MIVIVTIVMIVIIIIIRRLKDYFFLYIHLVVGFNTEKVFLWFHINAFFSWLCKLKLRHRFR